MQERSVAEWMLRGVAGRVRAAAIMGDLTEMAATRGTLWFAGEYARTLIALGWRTGYTAFVIAFIVALSPLGMRAHLLWPLRGLGWLHRIEPWFHSTIPLAPLRTFLNLLSGLIFLMPFVLVRFGGRDRVSRLTAAMVLLSVPLFSLRPWAVGTATAATLVGTLIVTAVLLPPWGRALVVVLLASLARLAILQSALYFFPRLPSHMTSWSSYISFSLALLSVESIVCVYLHRWLVGSGTSVARPKRVNAAY